jgi:hypothetical protein
LAYVLKKLFSGPAAISLWTALACFVVFLFAPGVFNDGDTYWHIEAGRWMIDNKAVLLIDPFSFTFAGRPWQTHEWLAEIVMALAYVGMGWNGVAILFAASFALAAGLLGHYLSRWLGSMALIATLELSLACMAGCLLTRPHILALPILAIWAARLIVAREEGRTPSWKLAGLMLLWANLHASFMFGLALAGFFAIEAVWKSKTRAATAKAWGLFCVLSLLAALATPHGVWGLIFPFKLMAMPSLHNINEWQPLNLHEFQPMLLAAGIALFALLSRGVKMGFWRLFLLLGLLYMAMIQVRHQILLAAIAPLLIAAPLAGETRPYFAKPSKRVLVPVFIMLFAFAAAVRIAHPVVRTDGEVTPAAALAHVSDDLRRQPVFNEYSFGGYLIFNDVHPFIDGRAELYGEDFIARYARIVRPDKKELTATLDEYRIRWTILDANDVVVPLMDAMPGWHRLYADKVAVVHVRDGGS